MDEIIKTIDESPIPQEKKDLLKSRLKKDGASKDFFDAFDKLLDEETVRRLTKFFDMEKYGNDSVGEIEKEREDKLAKLEEEVSALLKKIDPADFDSQEVIMDQYEKGVAIIQNDCLEKIKKVYSDGAIQLIKEGF